ncbi:hypothetical protein PS9374_03824 [Planomonospora sphaerica]|uniref:Uncharacterized protein n=1 Tax=Planomonospora sphaerica TaxID=161355 RepID=A0A171DEP6_9ACTN|nr:hypothetical protein [Planomonospora sphaerica]GAT68163.1 hypothetical protein PS9374_03824 [Planomonospora sphaerica]
MKPAKSLRRRAASVAAWALPYWTRGKAGRETPADLFRVLYLGWVVAFCFKVLGASWDVSWHFKWLRDDLAPPHLLNSVGTAIVVALTIVHVYTGYGVDRTAQRLIQWGTGTFLVAVPLDLINHRVNGLDITSWSPSHMLLYIGTFFMICGVIRGWFLGAPPGRTRTLVLGGLFVFMFENVWFPAQHQEYGVFAIRSWDEGKPEAEPILLQFAADQMGRGVDREMAVNFALPVPDQVYPLYGVVAAMIVLVFARAMIGRRFAATAVVATYVAYRALIWPILAVADFPRSAVPVFLIAGALAIDLAFLIRIPVVRALAGSLVATLAVDLALRSQHFWASPPLISPATMAAGGAALAALWLGGEWFLGRYRLRAVEENEPQEMVAVVSATATP